MIHLSKAAVREVTRLKAKFDPNPYFRLGVHNGGCCGLYYTMEFDTVIGPEERIYDCSGILVAIDPQTDTYIAGLTLDYSEDLMGGGFRFHNPNATNSCGCGNSFAIAAPPPP